MVKNNRIVSKLIYAPKGTVIHLLKPNYYYGFPGVDWKQEDTVIDENQNIAIIVCKAPINSTRPVYWLLHLLMKLKTLLVV